MNPVLQFLLEVAACVGVIALCRPSFRPGSDFHRDDGSPIECPICGSHEFKVIDLDWIDSYNGMGPVTEQEYRCMSCDELVAYWAYGYFDPSFRVA